MADWDTIIDGAAGAYSGVNPLFGAMYGAYKNAEAVKEKERTVADYKTNLDTWYDKNYNQDFLSTNVGKAALERTREQMFDQNKQAENARVVTGGTDEAVLAAKTKNNDMFSETVNKLAAMGTARQDRVDSQYRKQQMGLLKTDLKMNDADIASAQQFQKNSGKQLSGIMDVVSMLSTGGVV